MRLDEIKTTYSNWTFPSKETLQSDFAEYKKKEQSKWLKRSVTIGAHFPIFKDYEQFVSALRSAKVIDITDALDYQIQNRSHTSSLDDLRALVATYHRPRDIDRIVKGFKKGDAVPYPIILKGSKGMWIMAGNTRLDVAGIMGIPKKALLVDVSEQLDEDSELTKYIPKLLKGEAQKIATFIKKNCQPWLAQTKNGSVIAYRGFDRPPIGGRYARIEDVPTYAFTKKVRPNRRPLHSSQTLHTLLMGVIAAAGKTANRENSVAISGKINSTGMFGYPFVVMPVGQFNYTWHIDLDDWAENFVNTYGNSDDINQQDLSTFNIKLPKKITKQWLDMKYEPYLVQGVRGDDGTLGEALAGGDEIMLKADKVIAIDVGFYEDEVLPLLQLSTLKEGHEHKWSYIGGAAVCKCGKQISPDGKISDATASMMASRKKMFEERMKGTPLSDEISDEYVTIYRAQPLRDKMIQPMSYVTRSFKFAHDHAVHMANTEGEEYHVVRAIVKTKDVYNAYNPGEYFYDGGVRTGKSIATAKPGDDFNETV